MSTTAMSPLESKTISNPIPQAKSRTFVILAAFWHTLRRDMLVTIREIVPFLMQALLLPVSLLLVFGKLLPNVGTTQQAYPASLLPGVVAYAIFLGSILAISLSLMLDLDNSHEIDDRLLAPLPVSLVAVEKVVFAALRAMIAGGLLLLVAYWVLGSSYQVRTDDLVPFIGIMLLYSLSSAALGLIIGSALPADQMYLLFTVVFEATLYTGCVYYTWSSISSIKVLQIIALFNPMTYASEGLRNAMVPAVHGQFIPTLPIGWVFLGLSVSFVLFLAIGIWTFQKRVIS